MVYSPGNRDYQSAYPTPTGRSDAESQLPRALFMAVAVLGLASYAFSFGPVVSGAGAVGWEVRFAALAALCAGFGLLREHAPLPVLTAVLAAMGFLDALSSQLLATDTGWALGVIVGLNAVQAAAAIAALLMWPEPTSNQVSTAGYEAYVEYYNQAVRNYYGQQAGSAPPDQTQHGGYGQASGDARAAAQARRTQRPPQYGDYADLDHSGSRATTPAQRAADGAAAEPPTGLPNFGQADTSAHGPRQSGEQSAWPP